MTNLFGLSGSGFSTGVTSTAAQFLSLLPTASDRKISTTFAVASALTLAAVTSGCGSAPQAAGDRHEQGCVAALVESENRAHKMEAIGISVFGVLGLAIGFLLGRRSKS